MTSIGDRIRQKREELNMTQEELATKLGYASRSSVNKVEKSRILSNKKVQAFADALGTTPAYLMGWLNPNPNQSIAYDNPLGQYRIPVIATVAAGVPIYSDEQVIEWIDYHKDPKDHVFAVHVKGDSMMPRIHDGDIIIVDQDAEWNDGDIVVVTVNGDEGTCKRIKKYNDSIALMSLNQDYDPMIYTAQQVQELPIRVVGKVVESRSRF